MRRASLLLPVVLTLLLAPLVASLVGAWANGWTLAEVTTGSMRPGMAPGSLVVLVPVAPADVEVGDVIGFRDEGLGGIVTHRVVAVLEQPTGRFFTTQGDANPRADGRPVPARALVGEVRWRIAGLGAVADAVGERSVQLALAGVPLALLALSEVLGWHSRRLGAVIAALRQEIQHLRTTSVPPEARPSPEPGPVPPPARTIVLRVPAAPPIRPRPIADHVASDGSACVAGLR